MRWDEFRNGVLLNVAAKAGFDAFISGDKNLEYQQNLSALPLTVIALHGRSNVMTDVLPLVPALKMLLVSPLERALYVIQSDGTILKLTKPRER